MVGDKAKIAVAIEMMNAKYLAKAKQTQNATMTMSQRIGSSLKSMRAGFLTATVAVTGVVLALKKVVAVTDVQLKAEAKLRGALKQSTNKADEYYASLTKLASEIQGITTVGDEVTLGIMQLGLSMGVSAEKIGLASKEAIGLSKAMDINLKSAMKAVARARQDDFAMLERYIPEIRSATTATDKNAVATKKLGEFFELAMAEAQTLGGIWTQVSNAMGDSTEEIGLRLAPALKDLGKALLGASGSGGAFITVMSAIATAVGKVIHIVAMAIVAIESFNEKANDAGVKAYKQNKNIFQLLIQLEKDQNEAVTRWNMIEVGTFYSELLGKTAKELNELLDRNYAIIKATEGQANNTDKKLMEMYENFLGNTKEANVELGDFQQQFEKLMGAIGKTTKKAEEWHEKMNKGLGFVGTAAGGVGSVLSMFSSINETAFEQEMKIFEERTELALSWLEAEKMRTLELAGFKEEVQSQQQEKEIQDLATLYNRERNLDRRSKLWEQLDEKKQQKEKLKIEEEYDKKRADMEFATELRQKMMSRRMFYQQKEIKIAETIISGLTAGINAISSMSSIPYVGPFLGIAMAGVIAGLTAANVAMIQSTHPPMLYEGGIVPGSSRGMNVIAGERNQAEAIMPLDRLRDMIGSGETRITLEVDSAVLAEVVDRQRDKTAYRTGGSNYSYRSVY